MNKTHWLLCEAEGFDAARSYVNNFFASSMLLHYDAITADEERSCSADNERFWPEIEQGVGANQAILRGFIEDLQKEGCRQITDLTTLSMGYPSKLLHIIAHLVDGFIGIDSAFYNLAEDSHWISDGLRKTVQEDPARYWLIRVEASFTSPSSVALIHQVTL